MSSSKITLIDYHCGNLKSVEQALQHCGAEVEMTSDPELIAQADKLILPGVGAFPVGMQKLIELNLVDVIIKKVQSGTPLLGICLGMQLLLERSEEHGGAQGLGLIKGEVKKIESSSVNFKLPHIGWNQVTIVKDDPVLTQEAYFYFVHTYQALPQESGSVLATCQYQDVTFCAAVSQRNIWGMQFHPENSSEQGLSLLRNFINAG